MMKTLTTISVTFKTRELLAAKGKKGDTYDVIIRRLLNA